MTRCTLCRAMPRAQGAAKGSVRVVGGAAGMEGAARLVARAALAAGRAAFTWTRCPMPRPGGPGLAGIDARRRRDRRGAARRRHAPRAVGAAAPSLRTCRTCLQSRRLVLDADAP